MSAFVDEIIRDLEKNPELFRNYKGRGVQIGNVVVYDYGNTKFLSIISVSIKGTIIPTSYLDRWRLEVAIKKWYRKIPLWILLS